MDPVLSYLQGKQNEMLRLLRELVEQESPSVDSAAVNRLGDFLARQLRSSNGRVSVHHAQRTGDHIEARFFTPSARRPLNGGLLLLGHMDTVWESGTLREMPFRVTRGRAYGPGIFDMKAGIVQGIFALRALQELGLPAPRPVTFLLNADEEIGSPDSRRLTESIARRSFAALVLEPSLGPLGALKTSRKGVGEYLLRVHGRAAHAGLDPRKGASATVELARQIIKIQSFADYSKGITLNPGVVRGGTRGNVVADMAEAVIDVRIRKLADAARIARQMRNLRPADRRTRVEVTGGVNRPPFERSAEGIQLFHLARTLGRPLGLRVREAAVGGGSDGNITAALGVPTLDGLGAVGDGAHARDEHIVIAEMPRRAALLVHLIVALAADGLPGK